MYGGKKMIKISKQKLLTTTIILAILLISGACTSLIPSAHAATVSATQEQTNSLLNNVLGINASAYFTQINSQVSNQVNGLPQNQIDFTLSSNQSSVRVSSSFVNNTLNLLYLSEYSGTLAMTQPASSTASMAQDFLGNYQAYSGNSFYGTLASTLNGITGGANVTESTGDVTLKVLNSDQATVDYVWTYTDANGITAQSKDVVLSYYQGQLNCFLNNWPLYTVVGTPTISQEQAITTALAAIQNYTYQVSSGNGTSTVSVAGFQVSPESLTDTTLSYVNFPNASLARGGDQFNLYPSWYVPLGFENSYPGGVSGIAVTVWADNGQVSSTDIMTADGGIENATQTTATQGVSQSSTEESSQNSTMLSAPVMIAAILGLGALFSGRKRITKLSGGKKLFNPMLWGMLLCIIMFGAAISTVKADSVFPNSSARIYGSLDGGNPPNGSPAQPAQEQAAAEWLGGQLATDFAASGYTAYNDVGTLTTETSVTENAQYDENNYDHCTVFQFGHMISFGNGYVDNIGNDIWASDISSCTNGYGNYNFVFLWVCGQAQTTSSNSSISITPIVDAWLQDSGLTTNGYNSPDDSGKCFISFFGESPQIGNTTQTFQQQITSSADNFIQDFYYNALVNGYNIRDSLNLASLSFFGTTYTASIFCQGYDSWLTLQEAEQMNLTYAGWYPSMYVNGNLNSMQVFGDSAMYLFQPTITLSANDGLSPTFYFNGEQCSSDNVYVNDYNEYSVSVSVPSGYQFDYFSYNGNEYSGNPSTMQLSGGTITAYFSVIPPPTDLTVNAIDEYFWLPLSPNVYIDGVNYGPAPVTAQLSNGYHTITLDDPTWDPYWNDYASFYIMVDQNFNYYGNGASILINSNSPEYIAALYDGYP